MPTPCFVLDGANPFQGFIRPGSCLRVAPPAKVLVRRAGASAKAAQMDICTKPPHPRNSFNLGESTYSRELAPLAGLLYTAGQYEVQWGQLSAGVMISTVPVAILFTILQKHLIKGLTAGAMKG